MVYYVAYKPQSDQRSWQILWNVYLCRWSRKSNCLGAWEYATHPSSWTYPLISTYDPFQVLSSLYQVFLAWTPLVGKTTVVSGFPLRQKPRKKQTTTQLKVPIILSANDSSSMISSFYLHSFPTYQLKTHEKLSLNKHILIVYCPLKTHVFQHQTSTVAAPWCNGTPSYSRCRVWNQS